MSAVSILINHKLLRITRSEIRTTYRKKHDKNVLSCVEKYCPVMYLNDSIASIIIRAATLEVFSVAAVKAIIFSQSQCKS